MPILSDEIGGNALLMPLNEGAGDPQDYSGYNSHGTRVGAVWCPDSKGIAGRALDFDSSIPSYVEIPAGFDQLDFTSEDFSIVMKVYFEVWRDFDILLIRGANNLDGWILQLASDGKVQFLTCQAAAQQVSRSSEGDFVVSTWYTLGITREGSSVKIYKNGVETTLSITGTHLDPLTSARDAIIGATAAPAGGLHGKIEWIKVFDRALSAAEQRAYHLGARVARQRRPQLQFDGSAPSNINCGAIYNASAKLWVSFWFKLDEDWAAGGASVMPIWGKVLDGNDRMALFFHNGTGRLTFDKYVGGVPAFEIGSAETSWTAGQWYHVLVSISDVNAVRLIIDGGTPRTHADVSAAPNGGDFVFGDNDDPGAGVGVEGVIADFVCGTDDLTPAEEAALYNGIAPGDETDRWPIDEGEGTQISSYGSAYNNGVAGAGCSWLVESLRELNLNMVLGGPVLALPMQEGSGIRVADISGFGNHGAFGAGAAAPTWTRLASGRWCLSFDGNDDEVNLGQPASLFPANGTWEAWINIHVPDLNLTILSCDASGSNIGDAWFHVRAVTNKLRVNLINGALVSKFLDGNDVLAVDTWFHVAFTFGAAGMKTYVNGVLQTDTDVETQAPAATQDLMFGMYRPAGASFGWNGQLALPRIHSRNLTAAELLAHYQREKHLFGLKDASSILARVANTRSLAALR